MVPLLQIDDDKVLCDLLSSYLAEHGFKLSHAQNPHIGLDLFNTIAPRLVILDVMLPEIDGLPRRFGLHWRGRRQGCCDTRRNLVSIGGLPGIARSPRQSDL